MRLAPACALLVACGFSPQAARDGGAGSGSDAGTPGTGSLVDDTAADFGLGTPGAGAVIADRGAIETTAYIGRGLRARACALNVFAHQPAPVTYADMVADCGTFIGAGYAMTPGDYAFDRPRGLGLTSSDNFTAIYDGEIQLPAGASTLTIAGDDTAYVEVATDGVTFGSGVSATFSQSAQPLALQVAAAGFYPIHVVVGESVGAAHANLTLTQASQAQPLVFRYDVTREHGVALVPYVFGFLPNSPGGLPITAAAQIGGAFGMTAPPLDVRDAPPTSYTLRYVGQVLIDRQDTYTFGVVRDAGSFERLWVDGALVTEDGAISPISGPTATMVLSPGWHDLIVDCQSAQSPTPHNASFGLTLAAHSTPQPIPADHLRPAMTGGEALAVYVQNVSLNSTSPVRSGLTFPALAGFVMDAVDVFVSYTQPTVPGDWTVELDDATPSTLVTLPAPNVGAQTIYAQDQTSHVTGLAGDGAALSLLYTHSGGGSVAAAGVTLEGVIATGHGGNPPPFPTSATYTSAVHATPNATTITALTVDAELHGGAVAVQIAVGPDAAHLGAPTPVTPGTGLTVPAGAVLQYTLTLTGDGWHAPAVERVAIDYATLVP